MRGWDGLKLQLLQQLVATPGSQVSAALAGGEKVDGRPAMSARCDGSKSISGGAPSPE